MTVVGWTDCYLVRFPVAKFTNERKKALVERIKKRQYNFNHIDHCFLPFCCPVYEDGSVCELNKVQWDSVMDEVYNDEPRGPRLMPMDVIDRKPINSILYEKEKFEPKGDENNG